MPWLKLGLVVVTIPLAVLYYESGAASSSEDIRLDLFAVFLFVVGSVGVLGSCVWVECKESPSAHESLTTSALFFLLGILLFTLAIIFHLFAGPRLYHPVQRPGHETVGGFLVLYDVGSWGTGTLLAAYLFVLMAVIHFLVGAAKSASGEPTAEPRETPEHGPLTEAIAMLFGAASPRGEPEDNEKEHARYRVRHPSRGSDDEESGEYQIAVLDEDRQTVAECSFSIGCMLLTLKGHDVPRSVLAAAAEIPVDSELYFDADGNCVECELAPPTDT